MCVPIVYYVLTQKINADFGILFLPMEEMGHVTVTTGIELLVVIIAFILVLCVVCDKESRRMSSLNRDSAPRLPTQNTQIRSRARTMTVTESIARECLQRAKDICGHSTVAEDMGGVAEWVTKLMRSVRARVGLYAHSREDVDREIRAAIEERASEIAADFTHRTKYRRVIREGFQVPVSHLPVSDNFASRGVDESLSVSMLNLPSGLRSVTEVNSLYDRM